MQKASIVNKKNASSLSDNGDMTGNAACITISATYNSQIAAVTHLLKRGLAKKAMHQYG